MILKLHLPFLEFIKRFRGTKNVMILKQNKLNINTNICFRGTKNVMILKLNVKVKSNSKSFRGTKNVMILKLIFYRMKKI